MVNKPLCNYFKAYEIEAEKYKDSVILFDDKKSVLIEQINKDIQEYNGVKFSIGLSLQFFKDEKDGTRKYFTGRRKTWRPKLWKVVILENCMMNK